MNEELKDFVGKGWLNNGLEEHASVASFCKFVIQMMSVGAPPTLLSRAIQAMDDEVNHAKICFAVAKRLNNVAASPGEFPTQGILDDNFNAKSILEDTIIEACINETLAHHYDEYAAANTEDEGIRKALMTIVTEERRHGELAWDFVTWLLKKNPELIGVAKACFEKSENIDMQTEVLPEDAEKYGFVATAAKLEIRRRVFSTTIRPKMTALFESIETVV